MSYCVYFVEAEGTDMVKIGYARNLRARLSGLSVGSPHRLILLGTLPGGADLEAELHERLAEHRVNGEWFRRSPAVNAVIATTNKPSLPNANEAADARRLRNQRTRETRRLLMGLRPDL